MAVMMMMIIVRGTIVIKMVAVVMTLGLMMGDDEFITSPSPSYYY